jgi:DNA mismatch endonuclease, patch repair protein
MNTGQSRTFKRDKRSPIPSSENISNVMSAIKQKNTKPEIIVRKALFAEGVRGYRLHWSKVPGKPDIVFPSKKIAFFINGCFWHRCPHCKLPTPKSNSVYWEKKFEANVSRDKQKTLMLHDLGWKTLVIWECQVHKDLKNVIRNVRKLLK